MRVPSHEAELGYIKKSYRDYRLELKKTLKSYVHIRNNITLVIDHNVITVYPGSVAHVSAFDTIITE
jgi:hypothetical protein